MPGKPLGWFAILLLLVAIFRMVPASPDRSSARAATPPVVTTIEPEESAAANIEASSPVYEWVERIPTMDERIVVLEAKAKDQESRLDGLLSSQADAAHAIAKLAESQDQFQKSTLEQLNKCKCDEKPVVQAAPVTATAPPTPHSAATDLPTVAAPSLTYLRVFTSKSCLPCKRWLASADAAKIAAEGIPVLVIDADELPPEQRPSEMTSIPYYELRSYADSKVGQWQRGPLTYQRFKDMERDVLAALKGAK